MSRVWTWVGVVAMAATGFGQTGDRLSPEAFQNLRFREIGPTLTTGRISDIAVDPKNASEPFCMTVLALKVSRAANGVSELHGQVSREMWKGLYPAAKTVVPCRAAP